MPARTLELGRPIDLVLTLGPHRRGLADPTIRLDPRHVVRATRTADGPATLELRVAGARLEAAAWGPGADRALDGVPALVGESDDRSEFRPAHRLVRELDRRMPGLRIGRSGAVVEALVPAVLEQ
jgi:hypothetical protein